MRAATAKQMKNLDELAILGCGIPSLNLMERAAQGIAERCLKLLEHTGGRRVVVFCGAGNNGGDGVAAARLLREAGCAVTAFLVGNRERMTEDTAAMERKLNRVGITLEEFNARNAAHRAAVTEADVFVDALFGIGLNKPVRGEARTAIEAMNECRGLTVSADIASGIEADTGRVLGLAVKAAETVTFTLPKPGHYVGDGGLHTGHLTVHDIGIPVDLVDAVETDITVIDEELVRRFLPERPADGHKGTFGRDYILAGSVGFTGAPVLAAQAAVRTGAGLVTVGVPGSIYPIAAGKLDSAMPHPLEEDESGKLTEGDLLPVLERMARCDAALIGPGLGRSPGLTALVNNLISTVKYPLVVDADGLNALSEHISILDERRDCPTIITPHDGEFARLGGDLSDGDRLGAARRFAIAHGCLLVLKGHCTLIVLPDGETFLNPTGNCGMAKGGSGDVLAGMILGLLGQGIHPVKATVAAVWLHGTAGDLAKAALTSYAMTPTDLLRFLPEAFRLVTE